MTDLSEFSDLIDAIYASTADFSLWPDMMRRVSASFGGDCSVLGVTEEAKAFSAYVAPLSDPAFVASYLAHYHTISPLMPRIRALPAGSVVTDRMVLRREFFESSEIYNEWILPQGIRHKLYAVLISEPGRRVIMGIHSGREFDQDRIILCRRLTPHLQRALEITLRTLDLRTKATRSAELLDLMDDAIAVIDYNGRPLLMNKAAEALVSPGGALRVECGRLMARSPYESEKLLGLLKSCFGVDRAERGGRMRLVNTQAEPLDVIVSPMAESGPWPHASPETALVFVKMPRRRLSSPDRLELQGLHGLTPAETAMALRLCEGMTLQKAAAAQGVRVSTARTHLKHIFDKTGTSRQAELVQRLLTQQANQDVPSRLPAGAQ